MSGLNLDDDALMQIALDISVGKPLHIVRGWMLIDVMLSDAAEQELQAQGLQPTLLFAVQTVFTSQEGTACNGESVLTCYMRGFKNYLFESKDTMYILAGRGFRKHASLPAIKALRRLQFRPAMGLGGGSLMTSQ